MVNKILEEQQRKYERILDGEKDIMPFICIVLDDIISGHALRYNNELWEKIVFSGRHYFIFCVLTTQDVKGVSDFLFILF